MWSLFKDLGFIVSRALSLCVVYAALCFQVCREGISLSTLRLLLTHCGTIGAGRYVFISGTDHKNKSFLLKTADRGRNRPSTHIAVSVIKGWSNVFTHYICSCTEYLFENYRREESLLPVRLRPCSLVACNLGWRK